MCGICGIYGLEDRVQIERMLSVLRHRGPDDFGIFTDESISLGHTRLSIIDLSQRGKQPISNEDGTIWLSVNGEIYNFIALREDLKQKGHSFYSHADSEVIIHAYEEYGFEFVKKLRGMFAFALYDTKLKRLILARDPIGKKPLYYYYDGNKLVFASEIKAILETGIKKEIDYVSLWIFLGFQYIFGDKTLFLGIKKVLPGEMLVYEKSEIIIKKYWDIQENILDYNEQYFVSRLRSLLEESVQLRMNADVPIGAYLSGGIDSSAVVSMARPYAESDFHTFSARFETFSELEYAKTVSDHVGTVHHEQVITAKMVIRDIPKITWYYDEPIGDSGIISNYYLAHDASKFVKVIIAGEGGDELFGGYSNYLLNLKRLRWGNSRKIVGEICRCISEPQIRHFPCSVKKFFRHVKTVTSDSIDDLHLNSTRQLNDDEIADISVLHPINANSKALFPKSVSTNLGRMLALDCKNLLPEKFLMKSDKSAMAHSIEGRMPLLDTSIIDFSFCIPPKFKIHNGMEKYILRKSVEDLLPKEILVRKKQGFGTTTRSWMENEMGEVVLQTINDGQLLKQVLKKERKDDLIKNFKTVIKHNQSKIWTLYVLEQWYDVFFKNRKI